MQVAECCARDEPLCPLLLHMVTRLDCTSMSQARSRTSPHTKCMCAWLSSSVPGRLTVLSSGCHVACCVQFIQLAGLTGTTATSRLRASSSGRDASLPGPVTRPPGSVTLLGPRQGNLWLVNALGQPVIIPLTHPGDTAGRTGAEAAAALA